MLVRQAVGVAGGVILEVFGAGHTSEPLSRALQHYMGHKNIMHTVRYTEMAPDRFKNFWKD